MYLTWSQAKTYSCRPSELLGIEDRLAAYYLDRAVALFGSRVDRELEEARQNAKNPQRAQLATNSVMQRWLGAGRFASVR